MGGLGREEEHRECGTAVHGITPSSDDVPASPTICSARHTRTIAAAGANIQGQEVKTKYCWSGASMPPQVGVGSATPSPKNESVTSVMMKAGSVSRNCVHTVGSRNGSTCHR